MKALIYLLCGFVGLTAVAAIPSHSTLYVQTLPAKKNRYMSEGVFTGGHAGMGSSLLGLRRTYSAKAQIERVILDIGNNEGKPEPKKLGYFQAAVDPAMKRVTFDLAQMRRANISEPQVKAAFAKSPYVASVEFTSDPQDQSGSLVLNMKRPVRVEVFQMIDSKKAPRVVMDITPVAAAKKVKR